ncbi:hypothetical protein DR64_1181 [Paraburkholderia xenovorans LB400]|nr:hypothetical protein DR64_1181 [Paraburkholderia xenovorans LB400]
MSGARTACSWAQQLAGIRPGGVQQEAGHKTVLNPTCGSMLTIA